MKTLLANRLKMLLASLLVVFSAYFGILTGSPVSAVDCETGNSRAVSLQTASERLSFKPNETVKKTLRVKNNGCETYTFKVEATPYAPDADTYQNTFEKESQWTQISRYIGFEKTEYSLAAGESIDVPYTINVPSEDRIAAGGQYAAIAVIVDKGTNGNGVNIVQRVMYQIYGQMAGDIAEDGAVIDWNIPFWIADGELRTTYTVKNDGNVDFGAYGKLTVTGLFGGTVYETPEKSREYVLAFPETTPPEQEVSWQDGHFGIFWVEQSVEIFGKTTTHTQLVFILPIWFLILLTIALILVIAVIVREVRKRRHSPSRKGRK